MSVSLRQALTIGVLRRAVLLAGEGGVDHPVDWVDILETPDGARWVRPRSLVMTTFYAVKDDPQAQLTTIEQLIAIGASGLAIALRPGVKPATEAWLPVAEASGFPIMELPPDVAYWQVTIPLIEAILAERAVARGLVGAITPADSPLIPRLTQSDPEGHYDLQDFVQRLSLLLESCPVAIATQSNGLIFTSTPLTAADRERLKSGLAGARFRSSQVGLRLAEDGATSSGITPGPWSDCWIYPVRFGKTLLGALILGVGYSPDGRSIPIINHSLATLAMALVNEVVAEDAAWQSRNEFLARLLLGKTEPAQLLEREAATLGWSVAGPRAAVLIEVLNTHGAGTTPGTPQLRRLAGLLSETLKAAAGGKAVPVGTCEGRVVALAETRVGIEKVLKGSIKTPFRCGIGPPAEGLSGLRRSYARAVRTLELGETLDPKSRFCYWDDLETVHLASLVANTAEARELYERLIQPLAEHDLLHDGGLVPTLEAINRSGGNQTLAARLLQVHRGTIKYRVDRMTELLGFDPTAPGLAARAALALALWRLHTKALVHHDQKQT